jgi:ketosteroid isomerase-like protein
VSDPRLDKVDIQETISRYHEGASLYDFDAIAACFTEDAVWEVPSMNLRLEGRDVIREQMPKLIEPIVYLVQINAPAIIEVDRLAATARSLVREVAKFKEGGLVMDVVGQFNDRLERVAGGWKFTQRTFTIIGTQTTTEQRNG